MDHIGVGLIGYGMIGRIHCLGYRDLPLYYPLNLPEIRLVSVCTSRPESAQAAGSEAGFARWTTDFREAIAGSDVTVVDCCAPNHLHKPVLETAFASGKHAYCEKPLALNGEEGRTLAKSAYMAGLRVGIGFNYRFVPALIRARQLMDEGRLGRVYTFKADYLHTGYQDPLRPMSWKMRKETAGGGSLIDLGSHVVDLVRFLLGEFAAVQASLRTFVPERPGQADGGLEQVTVDDAAWIRARMAGGAEGTIEVSRFATGMLDELRLEIFGELGAIRFSLVESNWLYYYDARRAGKPTGGELGWTRLETVQHYAGAVAPPARSNIGWTRSHAEAQYAFLRAVMDGKEPSPGIRDALRAQLVLDAAQESALRGDWVSVALE